MTRVIYITGVYFPDRGGGKSVMLAKGHGVGLFWLNEAKGNLIRRHQIFTAKSLTDLHAYSLFFT